MAVDISAELLAIMQAVYGRDVRGSIHDALDKMCDELNDAIQRQLIAVDTTLSHEGEGAEAAAVGSMFDKTLVMRDNLPDGTDLNNNTIKPGVYKLVRTRTYYHLPSGVSGDMGWLIVLSSGDIGFTVSQIIIFNDLNTLETKSIYLRPYYLTGLSWGPWININNNNDIKRLSYSEYIKDSILFLNANYTNSITTATYNHGSAIFQNKSFKKDTKYIFIVRSNYSGSNAGYLYLISNNSQVNAFQISPNEYATKIEWIPGSNYVIDEIKIGWDMQGVEYTVEYFEDTISDLYSCMAEEGDIWDE